jgi:O-antigen/teichoic acid export membrane protein
VGSFLKIASFMFLITPLRTMTSILANVSLRFFDQSFYGVFEEAGKLVLILVCIVEFSMGVHGLLYAIVISQLFVVLCYLPRTYTAYAVFAHTKPSDRLHFWNLLRHHRKWSIGASYIGTLTQNLRIWIIKLMLGTEAVGLFAFAYGMYSHIVSLMPLTTVLTPIIPRYIDARDQLARIIRASIKIQFVFGSLFLFGAWLTSYAFVHILFAKYVTAIPILYILLITVLSNGIVSIFTPVFAAFKEQQSLLFSNIFKSALTIIILPPAIYMTGSLGPAIEIVVTSLLNGTERFYRLKRIVPELSFKWRQVLHPDAYEKEAMATLLHAFTSRLPRIFKI